jgi:CheY-like chemotaxis protein
MNKQFDGRMTGPVDDSARTGRKIFIVEDESMVTMLIEDTLADLGYEVTGSASRIEEALLKTSSLAFDAAILDVNLNGFETFTVADRLVQDGRPFLFATGYGAAGLPDRFSGVPVLQKPFRQADMEKALNATFAMAIAISAASRNSAVQRS